MDITNKIKQELSNVLSKLNVDSEVAYVVEIPKDNTKGDYATNIAMQLTRVLRKNPRVIAEEVISLFDNLCSPYISFGVGANIKSAPSLSQSSLSASIVRGYLS